jgi:hypothetical protein
VGVEAGVGVRIGVVRIGVGVGAGVGGRVDGAGARGGDRPWARTEAASMSVTARNRSAGEAAMSLNAMAKLAADVVSPP